MYELPQQRAESKQTVTATINDKERKEMDVDTYITLTIVRVSLVAFTLGIIALVINHPLALIPLALWTLWQLRDVK